jgi:hypothetical protein
MVVSTCTKPKQVGTLTKGIKQMIKFAVYSATGFLAAALYYGKVTLMQIKSFVLDSYNVVMPYIMSAIDYITTVASSAPVA